MKLAKSRTDEIYGWSLRVTSVRWCTAVAHSPCVSRALLVVIKMVSVEPFGIISVFHFLQKMNIFIWLAWWWSSVTLVMMSLLVRLWSSALPGIDSGQVFHTHTCLCLPSTTSWYRPKVHDVPRLVWVNEWMNMSICQHSELEVSNLVLWEPTQGKFNRGSQRLTYVDRLRTVSYTHLTLPTNREV